MKTVLSGKPSKRYLLMSDMSPLFNYRPMKDFINYMSSYNNSTQAMALHTSGSDPRVKTTGTGQCIVNGVHVASLAAQATIDLSDTAVAETSLLGVVLAGRVFADNAQWYMLLTTEADGTPHVYLASNVADDVAPDLSIPGYTPTELTIALMLYDNDITGGAFTLGTTNFEAGATFTQLVGPNLMPNPDNWDKN